VPKKYVERVGDDGFKKQPIGLGPYKFVSHAPGIELIMEANEAYWRKVPSVKRLVFKSVPDSTTRTAMLKRGEWMSPISSTSRRPSRSSGPDAEAGVSPGIATFFPDFLDQWDRSLPGRQRGVRRRREYASIASAERGGDAGGASKPAGSLSRRNFEFALPIEPPTRTIGEGAAAPG